MNLEIKVIGVEDVPEYWVACAAMIQRGLEVGGDGEGNASDVLDDLMAQRAFLLVGVDVAKVVKFASAIKFLRYPNYVIASVYAVGGRGVIDNAQHWEAVKAWMRQQGATKVQGICKPAQARLWQKLGLQSAYQMMRQDL